MDIKYPRPQMVRDNYILLDGQWECNGQMVRVPYPLQSSLSGWEGQVPQELNYCKTFTLGQEFQDKRILLHVGAVDQTCKVYLNGSYLGSHEGGYLDFTFDISKEVYLEEENVLRIIAIDALDFDYPYGKQSNNRGGMWYTPVSGIWKTVWIEAVPQDYIESLQIDCNMDYVDVRANTNGPDKEFRVTIYNSANPADKCQYRSHHGEVVRISYAQLCREWSDNPPRRWDVTTPSLYDIEVSTYEDKVTSYVAFRSIEVKKVGWNRRVCLNGQPIFLHGVLDQGYFQDGIFQPREYEEFKRDILRMKNLGFNTLRKHIKIEPEQFYYYCDKLGMLVIQDMVNSGEYNFVRDTALPNFDPRFVTDVLHTNRDRHRKDFFIEHSIETVKKLHNHPCIVVYTIFNESWGQFESDKIYDILKDLDDSRLYDSTSGWYAQFRSDFDSKHIYFRNKVLIPKKRPMLLSECGGYSLKVKGHLFSEKNVYGYGACKDQDELMAKLHKMYSKMVLPAIPLGLCGCIYTQLSDVEDEINGLYTYDRKCCKVDVDEMNAISQEIENKLSDSDGLIEAIKTRRKKNER